MSKTATREPESTETAQTICGALLSPHEPLNAGFASIPGAGTGANAWIVCNRPAGHTDTIELPEPDPAVEAARQAARAAAIAAGFTVEDDTGPADPLDQSAYHQATDRLGNVVARIDEEGRQIILQFAFGTPPDPEPVV